MLELMAFVYAYKPIKVIKCNNNDVRLFEATQEEMMWRRKRYIYIYHQAAQCPPFNATSVLQGVRLLWPYSLYHAQLDDAAARQAAAASALATGKDTLKDEGGDFTARGVEQVHGMFLSSLLA